MRTRDSNSIRQVRRKIDLIDAEVVALLNRRAALASRLVAHKRRSGLPICDPSRELEVLSRVTSSSQGPLSRQALSAIFRQVIRESRRLEESDHAAAAARNQKRGAQRVAYQGEPGAFSEAAARLLSPSAELVPCATFADLLSAAESGRADLALLPIANSIAGPVDAALELLLRSRLTISREILLPIRQHLICLPGTRLPRIRTVESHPVALAQCSRFFKMHPRIKPVIAEDTAGAVREMVLAQDPSRAAIASEEAARCYGAEVLRRDVHDRDDNYTRFVALSRKRLAARLAPAGIKLTLALPLSSDRSRAERALAASDLHPAATMEHRGHDQAWQILDLDATGTLAAARRAGQAICEQVPGSKLLGIYPLDPSQTTTKTSAKNGVHRNGHHLVIGSH